MATYNGERYIREQIESIVNQDYDNWVVRACDDGSTDHTYDILKEYQEKFLDTINKQNEDVKDLQNRIFDLRKNEWKSSFPFLSAIALIWLGNNLN